jgi:hypothetical protein
MSIRPGTPVVIHLDPSSGREAPLKALVYDVAGRRLILSQTSPPILPPPPKDPLYISYITTEGDSVRRLGFAAAVSGFGSDYTLSSGKRVPIIIVDREQEPEPASLRKGFRIRTPSSSGLSLTIRGKKYPILDISLAGVNFIQPLLQRPFKPQDSYDCRLNIDGKGYPLKVRVVRVSETLVSRQVAAAFLDVGKEIQPVLSRKILLMERKELSGYG